MTDSQILRTLLIPFRSGRALLPNSLVVQVLPYATPLRIENAPPWVMGAMLWRARTIPLVSLEHIINPKAPGLEGHARIIVLNTLNQRPKLTNFALLGTAAPQLLNLTRMAIRDLADDTVNIPGIARWVQVNGETAIIPDLDAIESTLIALMRA